MYGLMAVTQQQDPSGNTLYDDGGGNQALVDPTGVVIKIMPGLGNKAAWMQTPVYIAFGASLVLGAIGAVAFLRSRK